MDNRFTPIQASIEELGITLNFVAMDVHVPEIKCYICTIKEGVRGIQCTLLFKRLPGRMTSDELVSSQIFWSYAAVMPW